MRLTMQQRQAVVAKAASRFSRNMDNLNLSAVFPPTFDAYWIEIY